MSKHRSSKTSSNSPNKSSDVTNTPPPGAGPPDSAPFQASNPPDAVPGAFWHQGLALEPGGRNTIADAAERIGGAVGAAHRQMRRRLELVRSAPSQGGNPQAAESSPLDQGLDQLAARMMQAIEEEVAEARFQAAHRLGQFKGMAGERLQQFGERLRASFSRSQLRARQVVAEHPEQALAAVASFCFAFGAALLVWNSRRR